MRSLSNFITTIATRSLTLCITAIALFSSCQKVISVDLGGTTTQYVIVGTLTDQPGTCQVSITQSKNFSDDNNFPPVSGATVTVEHNGVVTTLPETSSGLYQTSALTGIPGNTYQLTVHINDQVFTAASTMPQPVALDSIYTSTGRLSTNKFVTVVYHDPSGVSNYYHFVQYVNGKKEKTIFVDNDEFTDGQPIKSQLNYNNDTNDNARDIKTGDSVRINMYCIDPAVYKYWYSLNDGATGANESASPANPVSNITGESVMGYFSAQTLQSRTIRVP
jgi:hypothetical protein